MLKLYMVAKSILIYVNWDHTTKIGDEHDFNIENKNVHKILLP